MTLTQQKLSKLESRYLLEWAYLRKVLSKVLYDGMFTSPFATRTSTSSCGIFAILANTITARAGCEA